MLNLAMTRWKLVGAACVLLIAMIALYLGYEGCWLGGISIEAVPAEPAVSTAVGDDFRVAVLRSEHTAKFLASAGYYEAHAQYWRKLLQSLSLNSELISDAQLENDLKPYQVLVLPSTLCLSEKAKDRIRGFLKDGGGVLGTWAVGTRDENGTWKGTDFLRELTGADSFQFTNRPPPWFVSFQGRNPVTAGTPEGSRIQLESPERLEATALGVDGYWSDIRFSPIDAAKPTDFQGAVIHRPLDHGRVVWYGFQENAAVAGGGDKTILDSALANGLLWAGKRVLCAVDPWPAPYSVAVLLALDVEEHPDNAFYAANTLLKGRAKGTFFCVSDRVKDRRDLVRTMNHAGEIAVHGNTHAPFSQSGLVGQWIRLQSARWTLWRLVGTWASGFHPPGEVYNTKTLRALAGGGFRYFLTGGGGNSVLPAILRVSQTWGGFHRNLELVSLQRVTDDDLHFSPLGILGLDPRWMVRRILADFEIINGLGGLYVLLYHTQGLSSPEYVDVLGKLIEQFRQQAVWVATAAEIADWWALRSRLSVSVTQQGGNSIRLTVVSRAVKPVEGVVLSVYPPQESLQARAASVQRLNPAPKVVQDPSRGRVQLQLGRLEPGRTYTYDLVLSE